MEKDRKRIRFLLVFCILIVIAFALKFLAERFDYFHPSRLLSFKDTEIRSLTLSGEKTSQTLIPKKNGWYVQKYGLDFPAEPGKAETLIRTLHGLTAGNIVSRNTKKSSEFGIGKSKIVLRTVAKTTVVYVGLTYLSDDAYIRIDNQPAIYIGQGMGHVSIENDYRDLSVPFISDTKGIQSVTVHYKKTMTLAKSGETWQANNTSVPDIQVQSYLDNLSHLQANDITPLRELSKEIPELRIEIKKGDKTLQAQFYREDKENVIMHFTGSAYLYRISDVYISALEKTESDFTSPTIQP